MTTKTNTTNFFRGGS